MRPIDADTLYMNLVKMKDFGELTAKKAIRAVENEPTVDLRKVTQDYASYTTIDAVPIRHGKWITEECLPGVAVCSICGHEIRGIGCQYTKYCDECGARMDKE